MTGTDGLKKEAARRTALECWNIWRAKHGHDPYGMLMVDWPWHRIVPIVWRAHLAWLRSDERRAIL